MVSHHYRIAYLRVDSVAFMSPAAGEELFEIGLALVLGGALGNLTDRFRFGYVVDFIDFHYRGWHWPAFNLADTVITLGVIVLLIDLTRIFRRS